MEIVLVSPRNPLNIGAAARAMANFGFSRLTVVAPWEASWREARSAVGASALLQDARKTETLAEALMGSTLVFGTASLTYRKPQQPVVALPDAVPLIDRELGRGGRVVVVFGSEKSGLNGKDLTLCHRILTIPTQERQPSMNLGQAVAVCLYAISVRARQRQSNDGKEVADRSAAFERLELLAGVVEQAMGAANYSPASMRAVNHLDLEQLLRRLKINEPDARRILGLFRRILWRLKHGSVKKLIPMK